MGCATARPTVNERSQETKANSGQEIDYGFATRETLLNVGRLADPPEYRNNDQIQNSSDKDGFKNNDQFKYINPDKTVETNNSIDKQRSEVEHNNNGQDGDINKDDPAKHDGKEDGHTNTEQTGQKSEDEDNQGVDGQLKSEGKHNTDVQQSYEGQNEREGETEIPGETEIEGETESEGKIKICHLDQILCSKVKSDRDPPSVQDIALVSVDGVLNILVADDSNDSLKLFQRKKDRDEFQSVLQLSSSPFQIAVLKDASSIAITLPLERRILVVLLNKTLKLKSKLQTEKEYFGLAAISDSELACGAPLEYPPCVDITNYDGKVLSSFSTADNFGGLFADVSFISKTPEGLLVIVDPKDHALVCASSSGLVVWRYEPRWKDKLVSPARAVCDDVGRIYLADSSRKVIVQMSQDGHKITELPFLSKPHAVCFCDGILYVCAKSGHLNEFSK